MKAGSKGTMSWNDVLSTVQKEKKGKNFKKEENQEEEVCSKDLDELDL